MKKKYTLAILSIIALTLIGLFIGNAVLSDHSTKPLDEAHNYFEQGDYAKSIAAYKAILRNEPENVFARLRLADCYVAIGAPDSVEAVIYEGLELFPNEIAFYSYLSTFYIEQEYIFQAIAILDEGITETDHEELKTSLSSIEDRFVVNLEHVLLQKGFDTTFELRWLTNQEETIVVDTDWKVENKEVGELTQAPDGTYLFTAKNIGATKITSTIGSLQFQFVIQVRDQVLAEMVLETEIKDTLAIGQELLIALIGYDVTGERMEFSPIWTLKNNYGSLSTVTGTSTTFTAEKPGTEIITIVTYEGIKTEFAISIEGDLKEFAYEVVGNGNVNVYPNEEYYSVGTRITIEAEPIEGFEFIGWSGDLSSTSNPLTFTIETNMLVQAQFSSKSHNLQVHVTGKGRITRSSLASTLQHNERVTLTAVAEEGWKFSRWEGDVTGTNRQITVTMDGAKTIKAIFVEDVTEVNPTHPPAQEPVQPTEPSQPVEPEPTYTLTTRTTGEGQISRNIDGPYQSGTRVRVTAQPEAGWKFERWEGAATSTSTSVTITMDANKTIRAIFTKVEENPPVTYQLTTSITGEGVITRSHNYLNLTEGLEVTLSAEPREGWKFLHWEGDISSTSPTVVVTMNGNKHVSAVFVKMEEE